MTIETQLITITRTMSDGSNLTVSSYSEEDIEKLFSLAEARRSAARRFVTPIRHRDGRGLGS